VLSVVSAQLKAIQNAIIAGAPCVDIGTGGEMKIKRVSGFATCGVFITMNPGELISNKSFKQYYVNALLNKVESAVCIM
jgi:hypothetical protein